MFDATELSDELQALKAEMSRLLDSTRGSLFEASRGRADALTDQISAALGDLSETLSEQEEHLEKIIAERPVASLASAFALGVVLGLILRRH